MVTRLEDGHGQLREDGRFVRLDERFADHVDGANRMGMVWNWELFRCELHAVLELVRGLDGAGIDRDDFDAVRGLGQQHRELEVVLEDARAVADPVVDWPGCYAAIWELGGRVGLLDIAPGTPAPRRPDPQAQADGAISRRMVDWLLRAIFERDMDVIHRTGPIGRWALLAPLLHRQLSGTWALTTRRVDRTEAEHRELLARRRQHLDPCLHWEAFRE